MKLSDRLRDWDADIRTQVEGSPHTETRTVLGDTAALLDECERVLAEVARLSDKWGDQGPLVTDARATLAKLRGEA